MSGLSCAALDLFARAQATPGWTICDGEEDAARELGMAGLAWWKRTDPPGEGPFAMAGHTILTLYPAAR